MKSLLKLGVYVVLVLGGTPSIVVADVSVYSDLFLGDVSGSSQELIGYGSATETDGSQVQVYASVRDPSDYGVAESINSGFGYASTSASYWVDFDSAPEGDWKASASATSGSGGAGGCVSPSISMRRFRAVFQKSHYDSIRDKWVYQRNSSVCNGVCQPAEWCLNDEYNWIYINGWKASGGFFTYCQPLPPYPLPSATQPECIQQFGSVLWSGDNGCS